MKPTKQKTKKLPQLNITDKSECTCGQENDNSVGKMKSIILDFMVNKKEKLSKPEIDILPKKKFDKNQQSIDKYSIKKREYFENINKIVLNKTNTVEDKKWGKILESETESDSESGDCTCPRGYLCNRDFI